MTKIIFSAFSLVVLSLAASTQAMALNPQPEPPSVLRASTASASQRFQIQRIQRPSRWLPPNPCRRFGRCR